MSVADRSKGRGRAGCGIGPEGIFFMPWIVKGTGGRLAKGPSQGVASERPQQGSIHVGRKSVVERGARRKSWTTDKKPLRDTTLDPLLIYYYFF